MLGDYVYEKQLPETRGELIESLAECVLALVPDSTRFSNGAAADALFAALDLLPDTPENRVKLDSLI